MKCIGRRPTAPRGAARSLTLLAALSITLAVAGCNDDGSDPRTDPSSSVTGTPSGTPSTGSATGSATESASPSVTAATGVSIRIRRVSMNAPEGWVRTSENFRNLGRGARDPKGSSQVGLYAIPSLNPDADLTELAKTAKQFSHYQSKGTVHEPVDVNGVECYHISGRYAGGRTQEQFGAIHARDQVSFTFDFGSDVGDDERQQIIDSVLASVVWR
jgi:hypothetical protein